MDTKQTWPFLLRADDGVTVQPLHADRYYVFPETNTTLPHYSKEGFATGEEARLAYEKHEGSPICSENCTSDPELLGEVDVVLSAQQWIDELTERGIDLEDFGQWSAP